MTNRLKGKKILNILKGVGSKSAVPCYLIFSIHLLNKTVCLLVNHLWICGEPSTNAFLPRVCSKGVDSKWFLFYADLSENEDQLCKEQISLLDSSSKFRFLSRRTHLCSHQIYSYPISVKEILFQSTSKLVQPTRESQDFFTEIINPGVENKRQIHLVQNLIVITGLYLF